MAGIALGGLALHAGCPTSVVLRRRPGPIALQQRGVEVPLAELDVVRTDHGVAVQSGSLRVDLVEHLLAAIGGMCAAANLVIQVDGPEIPLLDGGAYRFALALRQLGLNSASPSMHIAKSARIEVDGASYRFEPFERTCLTVQIEFDHPLVALKSAAWEGRPDDFLNRISRARTFGFRRDAVALERAGRARQVDLGSVVVLDDDGTSPSRPGPEPDECARHKLLDLVGDLTLSGGVPRGRIDAFRPGHGATHRAIQWAREAGVLQPSKADCGAGNWA